MNRRSRTFLLAATLFFGSGALGLGYELVWIRKAAIVVGASQIALSTVLTAFFSGLALGAWFFGRYFRGSASPLRVYGVLEVLIGLYALAFPALFGAMQWAYAAAYPLAADSGAGLFALRFVLLFALFLPPTFLMGGTLPLLLDGLVASDRGLGARTSVLYGINILGAVAGVLLTGYLGIPWLGVNGCSVVGGLANLAIGAVALWVFRAERPIHESAAPGEPLGAFFASCAFASGLLAIGYQVLWARYFTLFNFSTVYMTAILLAVYLLALALGSFALAPLLHARFDPLRILAVVQAFVPLAAWLTLPAWRLAEHRLVLLQEATPGGGSRPVMTFELDHSELWHFFSENLDAILFAPLFQVALVLFLPVALIGVGLPGLIAAAARRSSELRGVAGRLVFWNTLGASAGGFVAGYVLLPLLGLHRSWFVFGIGSLGLAVAIGWRTPHRRIALAVPGAVAIVLAVVYATAPDLTRETLLGHLTRGREPGTLTLQSVIEGPLTTAYIADEGGALRLGSGSVQMGHATRNGVSGQALAGHFPVLWYSGAGWPREALGLCLGSGQSFGALLRYPVERVDVVEISAEVTDLALGEFAEFNNHLADDPRVRVYVDDARHFIGRAADASYDLISMESPPPTADGVYSLYSLEFFREAKRVLRPQGVLMHFLPLYFLTPRDAQSVVKTMHEVFPYTFLVKVTLGDYVLLGYPERPRFVPEAMDRRAQIFGEEWTSRGLPVGRRGPDSLYALDSFAGLAALMLAGPDAISALDAPHLLDDDHQLLGYGTGDRWLARRYQGTPLTHLGFSGLPLSSWDELGSYFDPAPGPREIAGLTAERVAALRDVNVRDPEDTARRTAALEAETEPSRRSALALSVALDHDAVLHKDEAFRFVEIALAAAEGRSERPPQQHVDAVRKIVRNRVAVYEASTERWVEHCRAAFAPGPLRDAIVEEWEAYSRRREAVERLYLFPGRPG